MDDALEEISAVISTVSLIFYALLTAVLVVYAIYIGYKFATADDDSKRKDAKQQLIYAIVGVVAAVAFVTLGAMIDFIPAIAEGTAAGGSAIDDIANSALSMINSILSIITEVVWVGLGFLAAYLAWKFISADDDSKRKSAKTQLIYAVIGILGVLVIQALIPSLISAIS